MVEMRKSDDERSIREERKSSELSAAKAGSTPSPSTNKDDDDGKLVSFRAKLL